MAAARARSLPTFEVTASAGRSPLRLTAEAAELAFELAGEGQGLYSGRVVLSDGAVRAPAHQLRLSGIAADVHPAGAAGSAQPRSVSIASIAHEGAPPWFAPLRLTGVVQPKSGKVAAFDLELGRPVATSGCACAGSTISRAPRATQSSICRRSGSRPTGCNPQRLAPVLAGVVDDCPANSRCAVRLAGAQAETYEPISTCWSRTWRSAQARRALPRSTA